MLRTSYTIWSRSIDLSPFPETFGKSGCQVSDLIWRQLGFFITDLAANGNGDELSISKSSMQSSRIIVSYCLCLYLLICRLSLQTVTPSRSRTHCRRDKRYGHLSAGRCPRRRHLAIAPFPPRCSRVLLSRHPAPTDDQTATTQSRDCCRVNAVPAKWSELMGIPASRASCDPRETRKLSPRFGLAESYA